MRGKERGRGTFASRICPYPTWFFKLGFERNHRSMNHRQGASQQVVNNVAFTHGSDGTKASIMPLSVLQPVVSSTSSKAMSRRLFSKCLPLLSCGWPTTIIFLYFFSLMHLDVAVLLFSYYSFSFFFVMWQQHAFSPSFFAASFFWFAMVLAVFGFRTQWLLRCSILDRFNFNVYIWI